MSTEAGRVGAVVIGRNEGERLKRCLASLPSIRAMVYVDSGSTDVSPQWAADRDAEVIQLDNNLPFTAARARNSGFRRLQDLAPNVDYVQFIDGDCEMCKDWLSIAASFLDRHPDVGAVCGRRRERFPERSVYNWLCGREWDGEAGEVRACGGEVMIRSGALRAIAGYRDDMIAGEEPELCVRLRKAGLRTWRLDAEMTCHDAAMIRFDQWWTRVLRGGYAFAHGAYLYGKSGKRHWVWESRRPWIWGVALPLICLSAGLLIGRWGWMTWLIFPLQVLRQSYRNSGTLSERFVLSLFQLLARFPEAAGEIKFMCDRILGHRLRLIEYK